MADAGTLAGLRVVLVNWRDRGHPQSGGAEEYAEHVAEALRRGGARVTFLTARGEGQARRESGPIRRVRRGGRWSVYAWALGWLLRHRRSIDVVVDCQNGIPFFSPLVLRRSTTVMLVMHHVHDAQFAVHFPGPVARFGAWLEGPVARRVYRRAVTVSVSPSTVDAMRSRLGWTGPVFVVPNGMRQPEGAAGERTPEPTLVCLGRLVAHKRVDQLIEPVLRLRETWPGLTLHVVGRGPMERELRAAAAALDGAVVVHGYLDEDEKARLLDGAWLSVTLSDGEGWGLAVLEAAAHGVPTVCRDVDGLRDSVRHGETGWLMNADDDLVTVCDKMLGSMADPSTARTVAQDCRRWAAAFDWELTGKRFTALVAGLQHGSAAPGWRPGQHEALVAYFRAPAGDGRLRWAVARIGIGTTFGVCDGRGWLLAEQHPAGDLVSALHEAGADGVTVRAAGDVERLLGTVIDDDNALSHLEDRCDAH